ADIQTLSRHRRVFEPLLVYENYPRPPEAEETPEGITVTPSWMREVSHYPLTLVMVPGDSLVLKFDYRPDLFDEDEAKRIVGRLLWVLEQMTAGPLVRVGDVGVADAAERLRVVSQWND